MRNKINKWWSKWLHRRLNKQLKTLQRDSEHKIQLKEFQGSMYIAIAGIPLVKADQLSVPVLEAIAMIRQTWVQYNLYESESPLYNTNQTIILTNN